MTSPSDSSSNGTHAAILGFLPKEKLADCLPCICICIVAFIYALVQAIRTCNGQWDSMVASMLLAIAVKRFGMMIEPVMIVITGGIVGFVYVAFFMALFAIAGAA